MDGRWVLDTKAHVRRCLDTPSNSPWASTFQRFERETSLRFWTPAKNWYRPHLALTQGQDAVPEAEGIADLSGVVAAVSQAWDEHNEMDAENVERVDEAQPSASDTLMSRMAALLRRGIWQLQHIKAQLGLRSNAWTQATKSCA